MLYKQGAAVRLLYISCPWRVYLKQLTLYHRLLSWHYGDVVVCMHGQVFEAYYPRPNMERLANYYFSREQRAPGFLQKLRSHWLKHDVKALENVMAKIEHADLANCHRQVFLKLFHEFGKYYEAFWSEVAWLDAFDAVGEDIIHAELHKWQIKISDHDLHILTSVTSYSWLQKEKQALIALARSAKKDSINSPEFYKKLSQHSQRWHWLYNDYAVVQRLDEKFFLNQLRAYLKNPAKLSADERALRQVTKSKIAQQKLYRALRLPRAVRRMFALFNMFVEWRDTRKIYNQMGSATLARFAEALAQRTKFSRSDIESLFCWEVPLLFKNSAEARSRIRARRGYCAWVGRPDTPPYFFGQSAKNLRNQLEKRVASQRLSQGTLKGRSAFAGQIAGTVKIIVGQHDFKKMKRGDILVAMNTRPEYVPIMKIAGAIITEEGGITTHAAIVSRELKIPCVVGVQGAMSLFQDGDQVEVDAGKGVVRKI